MHCSSTSTEVRQALLSNFRACRTTVQVVHCSSTNIFLLFSACDRTALGNELAQILPLPSSPHGCGMSATTYWPAFLDLLTSLKDAQQFSVSYVLQ